jgi:hypothetical protein
MFELPLSGKSFLLFESNWDHPSRHQAASLMFDDQRGALLSRWRSALSRATILS